MNYPFIAPNIPTHKPAPSNAHLTADLITYIFPDFHAVEYFKRDFLSANEFFSLEESSVAGYDAYLVEQWVNERRIGSVVATYTGNLSAQIKVIKLTILKKPSKQYPPRFQEYLHELMMNHAKIKRRDERPTSAPSRRNSSSTREEPVESSGMETNEVCFVTNLASLPSILNLIPLTSGDVRETLGNFVINSNLKKLQCGGRSLYMTNEKISDSNEDKFRQMYKVLNPKIPIRFCIRELVNTVQTCLFYFDLLDAKYCDGLLCNKTEEAIQNWWNLVGLPHFNTKPNIEHGILSSTTVAAIISMILSIKLRLQLVGGCDVPKDAFDFENFMISIGHFQKQFKLEKRRKLDLETLNRIFSVTNAKLLPERPSNFSPDTSAMELLDYDNALSPSPTAYRRKNKSYYSKELKKLTNVVKSTLQDPINSDDKSSGARIRNKIAKLSDNISPLDVETLDLEHLVRNYLIGKTLTRLFLGESKNASVINLSRSSESIDDKKRARGSRRVSDSPSCDGYYFVSLKQKISLHQPYSGYRSGLDPSKYTRGFNRVKFGIQSRRNLLSRPKECAPMDDMEIAPQKSSNTDPYLDYSKSVGMFNEDKSHSSLICNSSLNYTLRNPVKQFQQSLNRRRSYPCDIYDKNLNVLAAARKDPCFETLAATVVKGRRASFSAVEESLSQNKDDTIITMERLAQSYLGTIDDLLCYEAIRDNYNNDANDAVPCTEVTKINSTIKRNYKLLNMELIKVKNAMSQMSATKAKVIDEDFVGKLVYGIHDLSTVVDRLVYETRIVKKRITELEETYKVFDMKLNHQCKKNLAAVVESTLSSRKFEEVFTDPEEREDIIKQLQYKKPVAVRQEAQEPNMFQSFVRFMYEMVLVFFQLFRINRSHMNLDRIRAIWGKLDPNRDIIDKAYSYVGRAPYKNEQKN